MVIDRYSGHDFPEVHSVTLIERLDVISQEMQARPQKAIVNLFSYHKYWYQYYSGLVITINITSSRCVHLTFCHMHNILLYQQNLSNDFRTRKNQPSLSVMMMCV